MPRKDYSPFAYEPRPTQRESVSILTMVFAGMIVVLVSLMFGHVVVKGISKAAAYNFGMGSGW